MAITIHHMTAKLAKAHGFTIAVENDEVVVRDKGVIIASHHSGSIALKEAIAALEAQGSHPKSAKPAKAPKKTRAPKDDEEESDEDDGDQDADIETADAEDDEESDEGKSIVKRKYKQQYRPFKQTCGDDLAQRVSAHVKVTKQIDGKSVTRIDPAKLKKFARANGCWIDSYEHLNVGMRRMNVANRLRKLVDKDGWKVVWA